MDIPIDADIICEGEVCGRSKLLVINPTNDRVTHLVVAEISFPYIEYLIPLEYIVETTPQSIHLRCTKTALSKMEPFMETEFVDSGDAEVVVPYEEPYMLWPYSYYDKVPMPLEHKNIPTGQIVVHRGTPVKAADGEVGKVDEFLIDPQNGNISHLVMRRGHLWGSRDVTIPVSEIKSIDDSVIRLKLDKESIASLPAVPFHRKWK